MRLWSLHPRHLDRRALVACWREALLAQKVLAGATRGYRGHPQLVRFRAAPDPERAIAAFLHGVRDEATARGYRFDAGRVALAAADCAGIAPLPVTVGQLDHELGHLRAKVERRAPEELRRLPGPGASAAAHPLFRVVPGEVGDWERT